MLSATSRSVPRLPPHEICYPGPSCHTCLTIYITQSFDIGACNGLDHLLMDSRWPRLPSTAFCSVSRDCPLSQCTALLSFGSTSVWHPAEAASPAFLTVMPVCGQLTPPLQTVQTYACIMALDISTGPGDTPTLHRRDIL